MANKRISQLTNTITAFRTGDYIAVDGTDTAKMSKDDLLNNIHENELSSGNTITKNLCVLNDKVAYAGNPAYVSKFVYVEGISSVKVVPKTNAVIRFLKSVPPEVEDTAFDYATNAGSSITTETTFTLSSDTKYMYIGEKYNNSNIFPNEVTFDGVLYTDFAFENIVNDLSRISKGLSDASSDISTINRRLNGNTITENCWVQSGTPQRIINVGNTAYRTKFIYVEGITSIKVTPQTGKNAVIRFLTALPTFVENAPLPLATNAGTSVNVETTFTLSSDTKYMLVGETYNNGSYFPSSIIIDGVSLEDYTLAEYENEIYGIRNDIEKKVKFRKDSATQFSLYKSLNDGKLARHEWKRETWKSQENGIDVTDCDCWVAGNIYVDGVVIAQCNINFIYNMTENEGGSDYSYFVGSGHGCCVENYTNFYIDGKIIDFSSLANGTEIECKSIRIVTSANCWVASKDRTIANGGDGNKVYAMVDENGVPILSTIWNLDYTFDAKGEHYNNQLTAKRNGTKFNQCFGAMNSTQPNEFDHLHENDQFGSCCSWVYASDTHTITSIYGQDLNADLVRDISKATQHGSNYTLSVECENILVPYVGHVRNWFENGGRGRMKVYLNPVKTIQSDGSEGADVFNDGDIIRCKVERLLE